MAKATVALTALLLALTLLAAWTGREREAKVAASGGASLMKDVSVINTDGGKAVWSLRTPRAELPETGDTVLMGAVDLKLHAEDVTLRAESGRYDIASNSLSLGGGIRASIRGYTVTGDSLVIKPGEGGLSADGKVVLNGSGVVIEGSGLRAEEGRKVRLLNGVKAVFH